MFRHILFMSILFRFITNIFVMKCDFIYIKYPPQLLTSAVFFEKKVIGVAMYYNIIHKSDILYDICIYICILSKQIE